MDSVEVQEFLLSNTATESSMLMETDQIFAQEDASSSSSMYFSINDDTLSNRLVDDLKQMDRTLTMADAVEEEVSSVINTQLDATTEQEQETTTTKVDEEFFQKNLNLKLKLLPSQQTQCSTPKLEFPLKPKLAENIPQLAIPAKLDASLITDLVMPLTTVLQKIEKKKVTIVEQEEAEKENKRTETAANPRKILRKSLKPPTQDGPRSNPIPAKRQTMTRKSMIPSAPTTAAIKKDPKPSLLAARKSIRLSVVPAAIKSTRFTIGGLSGKINSPKLKRPTKTVAQRMTINAKESKEATTTTVVKPTEQEEIKKPSAVAPEKKRMSRIPFPGKSSSSSSSTPRTDFSCATCKKSFHLKSTLLTHQKIHAASAHFKCSYCGKDFEKEIGLRNHVERYCVKVPVADKRKLNGSSNHNRTNSAEHKDKSAKKEKSAMESTCFSSSSSTVSCSQTEADKEKEKPAAPASGLSPRKPIKSISQPHSGIKFSANKPIKCFHCQITFTKYVDFHTHVEKMHAQPVGSLGVTIEEEK